MWKFTYFVIDLVSKITVFSYGRSSGDIADISENLERDTIQNTMKYGQQAYKKAKGMLGKKEDD